MRRINKIDVGIADLGLLKIAQLLISSSGIGYLPDDWEAFAQLTRGLVDFVVQCWRVRQAVSTWFCLPQSLGKLGAPQVYVARFVDVDGVEEKLLWKVTIGWPALYTWPSVVYPPEVAHDNDVAQGFHAPVPG